MFIEVLNVKLNSSDVANKISRICSNDDMIIVMGAGDIRNITDDIYNEIIEDIEEITAIESNQETTAVFVQGIRILPSIWFFLFGTFSRP